MNAFKAKLSAWYHGWVQFTVSGVLGTLSIADLIAAIAAQVVSYENELSELFGSRLGRIIYASIRIAGAVVIAVRATQHRRNQTKSESP